VQDGIDHCIGICHLRTLTLGEPIDVDNKASGQLPFSELSGAF